jgi:hypothetical protein
LLTNFIDYTINTIRNMNYQCTHPCCQHPDQSSFLYGFSPSTQGTNTSDSESYSYTSSTSTEASASSGGGGTIINQPPHHRPGKTHTTLSQQQGSKGYDNHDIYAPPCSDNKLSLLLDTARSIVRLLDNKRQHTSCHDVRGSGINNNKRAKTGPGSFSSSSQCDDESSDVFESNNELTKSLCHSDCSYDEDEFARLIRQYPGLSLLTTIETWDVATKSSHLIKDHTSTSTRKRGSHDIFNGATSLYSTRMSVEIRINNLLGIENFKFSSVVHFASFLIACGGKPRYHYTNEDEEDGTSVTLATKQVYEKLNKLEQDTYESVTKVLNNLSLEDNGSGIRQ